MASGSVPPSLVTDLSKKVISINVNFSGSKFHIFGAVKRGFNKNGSIDQPPFDIIIEVIGPSSNFDLFKKEKMFGLWTNKKIKTLRNIPSFYSVAGTKPLESIMSKKDLDSFQIGLFEQMQSSPKGEISETLLNEILLTNKLKTAYQKNTQPIVFLENTLFSTEIDLPTDLKEGNYIVKIHLIRFKQVLASKEDTIFVRKVGIEQWLFFLAQKKPYVYGLLAVTLAIVLGWLASLTFKPRSF